MKTPIKFHGGLTLEEFYLEWMGYIGGRELGTDQRHIFGEYGKAGRDKPEIPSVRRFTSNPNDILAFVRHCETTHDKNRKCRPVWISAQPFREYGKPFGIEKLFFDFDDDTLHCPNCDTHWKKDGLDHKLCPTCKVECGIKPRLDVVGREVKRFIYSIKDEVLPLIVETYKGYHVYLFLRQVFVVKPQNIEFAKKVYDKLQHMYIREWFQFMDMRIVGDISRLARVPITKHEATGKPCLIVNENLKQVKVRHIEYFRIYGVPDSKVKKAVELVKKDIYEEALKKRKAAKNASKDFTGNGFGKVFHGTIRPCFQDKIDKGQMCHGQRLALLVEAYFSGIKTEEGLVDVFRNFVDFDEKKTRYYCKYFLKHSPEKYPPYRCKTIQQKHWCIENRCPIWVRKFKK